MLISLNWLREFVPYAGSAEELGARLTMLGLELEEIRRPFAALKDLVVGHVLTRDRHPDSDHLSLCRVDAGKEVLDIVCGAPNVAAGQYVVVAPVGAVLPGGLSIKKSRLRGRVSNGMLCSERELGLSDAHDGIMVLQELLPPDEPFEPGQAALDALKLDAEVLDIGITPNRGDCLSIFGLARETALAFDLPLTLPPLDYSGVDCSGKALDSLKLTVQSAEICPLYKLRCIENVRAARSPARLRWRLQAVGQRAISNLVDVTNYIMLELGQPLHSFDLHKVKGGEVRVYPAADGETIITLDGQERILTRHDLTIRDAERAIGLAGVMGGANSDIDGNSSAVMLEGAVFSLSHIRRTSKRLNLLSEAAYRFERGVDQGMTGYALEKAALMIARLGRGLMSAKALTCEPAPWQSPVVSLRRCRAEKLIGVPLQAEFCENSLKKLGCLVQKDTGPGEQSWLVTPPSYRRDLEREADLVEELARIYGFDNLPETVPPVARPLELAGRPEPEHRFFNRIKSWAAGLGLNEVINYSFVGHRELDLLGLPREERISILNPLAPEMNVLRPVLAPGLLNALKHNLAQGNTGLRLFEIAARFLADAKSETTANETVFLGLILHGERYSSAWPHLAEDVNYLDIKGLTEQLAAKLHLPAPRFSPPKEELPWLSPCVEIVINGVSAGHIGRVKTDIAVAYHARRPVWTAELDLGKLYILQQAARISFKALPVFPPVRRDITVIAPLGLQAETILRVITKNSPSNLENALMVDLFKPENKAEQNLTFRLTYRDAGRTLQDHEADEYRDKTAAALVRELPVRV
ncbi:MAG: phenylalanine--tRNA ligase subunit beta [Desulfovibrio sp.]|jgi:phenylalanyl-tRNA synthetase beta chain|nr:phenylalanine--tRNA ligase subunit beta [Desulfovibrio sp.]